MQKKNKGFFITIEGGEGAGKSTLMANLFESLSAKHISSFKTHEPGHTLLGKHIRELILLQEGLSLSKGAELLLFAADRFQHVEDVILPALLQHQVVLCDRFTDSTFAYQGINRIIDSQFLNSLCSFAAHSLIPDLTLLLDLNPIIGLQRTKRESKSLDRFESEELSFHQKVRKTFLKLAKKEQKRFCILDATLPEKKILTLAIDEIEKRLKS